MSNKELVSAINLSIELSCVFFAITISLFGLINTITSLIVLIILGAIWFLYDIVKYPICPICGHNLSSRKLNIWDKEAYCSKHGMKFKANNYS